MGELVRETYGAKSELKAQNTYCLQSRLQGLRDRLLAR